MQRSMNLIAIMAAMSIAAQPFGFAQTPIPEGSKVLTIGEVEKVDPKSKSITLNDATSYNIGQLSNAGDGRTPGRSGGGRSGATSGGGGGGGGRRGGGGGRGGGGRGGGGSVSTGRGASAPIPKEYKIVVSPKTVIKDGDTEIKFEDLHMGDSVQVFSAKGGTKVDAAEIIRNPKNN